MTIVSEFIRNKKNEEKKNEVGIRAIYYIYPSTLKCSHKFHKIFSSVYYMDS